MSPKKKLLVISGPTATGKTNISLKLAKSYDAVIVNFDSLLFYKEISIGTAKPTKDEQENIPHYMVDSHSIFAPINAADYYREVIPLINKLFEDNERVILVGGSGFYLQTILNGMFESTTTPPEITTRSQELFDTEGIEPFLKVLKDHDPESFERYHENDHYRIRRAVEHFWSTGEKFSTSRDQMEERKLNSPPKKFGWDVCHIHLDIPKEEHWPIIQNRTKKMLELGIIDEVSSLLKNGATGQEKPLKSIGYLEVIQYLEGSIPSLEACEERINISTRQLAKAQRTWFKKVDKLVYHPLTDWDKINLTAKDFYDHE